MSEGFIHVDDLAPLSPTQGLFSANIYLGLPPTGGELHIFNLAFWTRWQFYANAQTLSLLTLPDQQAQHLLRSKLMKLSPPLKLRPDPGDLVLLCTQRPHAVQGFPLGSRVSLQSFITHHEGKPLVIDN